MVQEPVVGGEYVLPVGVEKGDVEVAAGPPERLVPLGHEGGREPGPAAQLAHGELVDGVVVRRLHPAGRGHYELELPTGVLGFDGLDRNTAVDEVAPQRAQEVLVVAGGLDELRMELAAVRDELGVALVVQGVDGLVEDGELELRRDHGLEPDAGRLGELARQDGPGSDGDGLAVVADGVRHDDGGPWPPRRGPERGSVGAGDEVPVAVLPAHRVETVEDLVADPPAEHDVAGPDPGAGAAHVEAAVDSLADEAPGEVGHGHDVRVVLGGRGRGAAVGQAYWLCACAGRGGRSRVCESHLFSSMD